MLTVCKNYKITFTLIYMFGNFPSLENPLIGQKANTLSIYRKSLVNLDNMEITQGKYIFPWKF